MKGKRVSLLALALFALSLLLYGTSLNGEFILDDRVLIVNNVAIRDIRNLPWFFLTDTFNPSYNLNYEFSYIYYRPLLVISVAVDYFLWKLQPLGYHLFNITIHSLVSLLILLFIYELFGDFSLAVLTSLLFCVHPLQTQAVSYISNRTELLVSLFAMLSLLVYTKFTKNLNFFFYLLSLLSFILAILSREAGFLAIMPFLIFFLGFKSKLPRQNLIIHFLSFSGILAIYLVLRFTILCPLQNILQSHYPFVWDIFNFLRVLMEYLRLLIYPYPLYILRTIRPIPSFGFFEIFAPLIFLILIISLSIIFLRKKKYILLVGLYWFIFTLLYMLKFMYKVEGYISVEEQWVYLASGGYFLILAYLILDIKKRRVVFGLSIFLIIIYSTVTLFYNQRWQKEIGFYRYNLQFSQSTTLLRLNLMDALFRHGFPREAIKEAEDIISSDPQNWITYVMLGDNLRRLKRNTEARKAYENALQIDYFCWQAYRNLKLMAEQEGRPFPEEAIFNVSPSESKIIHLIRMGEFELALRAVEGELKRGPKPEYYILGGIIFGKTGQYRQAIPLFKAALKLDNQNLVALDNLSLAYERLGDFKNSLAIADKIKAITKAGKK